MRPAVSGSLASSRCSAAVSHGAGAPAGSGSSAAGAAAAARSRSRAALSRAGRGRRRAGPGRRRPRRGASGGRGRRTAVAVGRRERRRTRRRASWTRPRPPRRPGRRRVGDAPRARRRGDAALGAAVPAGAHGGTVGAAAPAPPRQAGRPRQAGPRRRARCAKRVGGRQLLAHAPQRRFDAALRLDALVHRALQRGDVRAQLALHGEAAVELRLQAARALALERQRRDRRGAVAAALARDLGAA